MFNDELLKNMQDNCEFSNNTKNVEACNRMLAGDPTARDRLICDNMPLVTVTVNRFVKKHPLRKYQYDDLISAGFLALTKAVNFLLRNHKSIEYMTAYLRRAVRLTLLDFQEERDHSPIAEGRVDVGQEFNEYETREMLNAACCSNLDRTVLRLREQGYSFREIAAEIGCHHNTVKRRLDDIHERYSQKMKNLRKDR